VPANLSRRGLLIVALAGLALAALAFAGLRRQLPAPEAATPSPPALTEISAVGAATQTSPPPTFTAAVTVESAAGFGILGDSNTDEYRADDDRGGEYAATTLSWVELLAARRGLNFGPWGSWGEPRRTGYKYNWARSGATTHDLIASGQHTGLAQLVAGGEVAYVFVFIGGNDFALWNGTYDEIYDGRLSGGALQAKLDGIVADLTTAVDTVLSAGQVDMVIVTIGDAGLAPDTIASSPEPAKRRRVTDAINQVNARIAEMAIARGVAVVDTNNMLAALGPQLDPEGNLSLGGEQIALFAKGDEPHHGRLGDGAGHPGTVLSAYIANILFIEPFNSHYGLNIAPLSDNEILEGAGLPPAP
jgi:phospholipase/lecithinase/hemolysin